LDAELTWMPAWKIAALVAAKEVSPVEVTEHFLGRIETFQPTLKAFKHVDPAGAIEQARAAERAVLRGEPLGPLHGVPISVKEHIAVAGMPVTNFIGAPDRIARSDELAVTRLRAAGAIIVGVNAMMGTRASEPGRYNWEAEARNPWDLSRVPGWSSSGGAAAAAARLVPIALGSDGGGSTRLPSAYCSLVGMHPTSGLVPSFNYAIRMRADRTTTVGPLARDVRDAALTLQAIAGPDGRDFDVLQGDPPDLLGGLGDGAEGLRLAWTDDFGFASMYAFEESARIIEFVRDAAQGLTSLGALVERADVAWEDFFPGFLATAHLFRPPMGAAMPPPSREAWASAMDLRQRNWTRFRELFRTCDLLVSPTAQLLPARMEDWAAWWGGAGPVAFPHKTFTPHYTSHTHMFNWLGFPAISVPAGFVNGLPVGLQFVGWPGDDSRLLRLAEAFLRAFPRREKPPVS